MLGQEGSMTHELVTVVVATYNRNDMLKRTLEDLLLQRYPQVELLVIDQTPQHSEEVAEALRSWHETGRLSWVTTETPGLTRARNMGLTMARGTYVIYIDDDVQIPDPDFIQHHVSALQQPGVGAVAGRVVVPDRAPLTQPNRVGWLGFFGTREPGFGSTKSQPAETVRGCNMSFSHEALVRVGGFDEQYTRSAFREDTDVAWRLRRQGYHIWFSAEAWLYHLSAPEGGTRDQGIPVAEDLILNDVRFARKNLSTLQQGAWLARLYGSRVVKAGLVGGAFAERQRAFWRALEMTRNGGGSR